MKHLHKIIALFILIFATGIVITISNINSPLNKETHSPTETVKIQKDSTNLNKIGAKIV